MMVFIEKTIKTTDIYVTHNMGDRIKISERRAKAAMKTAGPHD